MPSIAIYSGGTPGGTDGTEVNMSSPMMIGPLDAYTEGTTNIRMALRCDEGYQTIGRVRLRLWGIDTDMFQLAPEVDGAPGEWNGPGGGMVIDTTIDDTNTMFWLKGMTDPAEEAQLYTNETGITVDSVIIIEKPAE